MSEAKREKKARKRGSGEGSIFKRTRRGRVEWVGEISVGFDAEGKRRKRTVYGQTMAEVQRKLEEVRAKARAGIDLIEAAGRQRLGDFLTAWADSGGERWKPGTLSNYRDLIRLHIKPYLLAGHPLEAVRPGHVLEWQVELRRTGLGARTRQAAHSLLQTALKTAVRMNLVLYNAAERVEPPRVRRSERVVLDREHVLRLLAVAEGSRYESVIVLAALHGLRVGEVLGLRWGDVDLREGVLHVRRQLVEERRTGKRELAEVKTAAGKREIPLSGRAGASLQRHRARLGAVVPHPERLLFTDALGAPLRRSNFHRRVWAPLRNAAALPKGCRFHDLRHACASALLAAGVDVATVSGTVGHSSPAVTMRIYSHALPSRMREAAARVDALYGA